MPATTTPRAPALVLATLLTLGTALPRAAPAQETATAPRIEQQMTPEQFSAAGLDRLTPEQLENLNAWLNRTLVVETQKAAAQAKKKVEDDDRGFLNSGSKEPVLGQIKGSFDGFGKGRRFVLADGQEWEQVDTTTLHGAHMTDPEVRITPSLIGSAWYMQVGKYNTRAKVKRIK